jgi:CD63 antigen
MTKAMEASFSSYTTNKDVAEKWKSIQQQMQCCGIHGPTDYRGAGIVDWSCCKQATQHEASCQSILQRGCLVSLAHDIQNRVLWVSVLSIATAIIHISGVCCSCCFVNSLKAEAQRRKRQEKSLLKTSS